MSDKKNEKESIFGRAKQAVRSTYQKAAVGMWSKMTGAADKKQFIDVGGKRTQVLIGGSGDPLLYLHSSGGEATWLPFHDALSKHFTVIAPAHPGFADSEGMDQIDGMDDVLFHYLDFFEAMGLERVNLMGTSLGGWIALEFAMRYPEKVDRLILIDSCGLYVDGSPIVDLFAVLNRSDRVRKLIFHDPDSFVANIAIPNIPSPEQTVIAYRAFTAAARIGWNTYFSNPKMRERLWRIKNPTLIIWGENDKLIPVAHAHAFHEGIKDSQLALIPNCGHMPIFEQPDLFVKAALQFLKSPAD
jgi:pimeloyl-ACP methyl ester carboxylesterase